MATPEERLAQAEITIQNLIQQQQQAQQFQMTPTDMSQLIAQVVGAQAAATASASSGSGGHSAVESRVIGKPDRFDGSHVAYRDWAITFRAYAIAVMPALELLLTRAETTADDVMNVSFNDVERKASLQLYHLLIMTCQGSALNRVVNSGQSQGLKAWRSLTQFYDPNSKPRKVALLMELLSFSFEGDLTSRIESYERELQRYHSLSGRDLDEDVKVGIVLKQLPPGSLKDHLVLNADKFDTWAKVREELEIVRRATMTSSSSVPMDVDSLTKQLNALGYQVKGKGKGKKPGSGARDGVPKEVCHTCKKAGHKAEDCWYNPDAPPHGGKGGGKVPGGGKGGGRGGCSVSASRPGDKSQVKCWNCGNKGHTSRECKKPKKLHALEDGEPEAADAIGEPAQVSSLSADIDSLWLCGLADCAPNCGLCAVEGSKPTKFRASVDSGAAVTALPEDLAPDYPVVKDKDYGKSYYSATGEEVKDQGLKKILVRQNGCIRGLKGRKSKVKKVLIAAYDVCAAGHKVVFDLDDEGSYAENKKTGERIKMDLRGRTWEWEFEIVPYDDTRQIVKELARETKEKTTLCPFQRQVGAPQVLFP